jgi:hypothetical protein
VRINRNSGGWLEVKAMTQLEVQPLFSLEPDELQFEHQTARTCINHICGTFVVLRPAATPPLETFQKTMLENVKDISLCCLTRLRRY